MLAQITARAIFPLEVENTLKEAFFRSASSGFFVEVGANEPKTNSQTWHLEQLGWRGILIEPQPALAHELKKQRRAAVFGCACSSPQNAGKMLPFKVAGVAGIHSSLNLDFFVAGTHSDAIINVPVRTLDDILAEANAPTPIDLLSIDVESHEIDVLNGLTLTQWRPRLILIEDLALDPRLHRVLRARGYKWVRRTGLNSWYVPIDSEMTVSPFGCWQFLRKYYLGVPIRRFRETKRKLRERLWAWLAGSRGG
jgi:FkbM family methyltransferase